MALILVIDDDGFYRGVIRRILEDGGHQVLETEEGREAVDLYRQFRPDVVVTDIFMPGMDGGEVIRALRAVDNHVKIVAVSGGGAFYDVDVLDMALCKSRFFRTSCMGGIAGSLEPFCKSVTVFEREGLRTGSSMSIRVAWQ